MDNVLFFAIFNNKIIKKIDFLFFINKKIKKIKKIKKDKLKSVMDIILNDYNSLSNFNFEYLSDFHFEYLNNLDKDNKLNKMEKEKQSEQIISTLFKLKYKNPDTNKFMCEFCNKEYKYFGGLYTHKRLHDPNYTKKYSCSVCNSNYDSISHIKEHLKMHERRGENCTIIMNKRRLYRVGSKLV